MTPSGHASSPGVGQGAAQPTQFGDGAVDLLQPLVEQAHDVSARGGATSPALTGLASGLLEPDGALGDLEQRCRDAEMTDAAPQAMLTTASLQAVLVKVRIARI